MADVVRTCANCGSMQATGDFCEKCGTRMPAAPAPPAAAAYSAAPAPAPGPAAPPPPYAPQAQYGAPAPAAPQYGYPAAGGEQYGPAGDVTFAFTGAVKRSTLKMLWWIAVGLIGLYVVFNLISMAMAANRFSVILFFASLFFAGVLFVVSWVIFEGLGIALRLRDKAGSR